VLHYPAAWLSLLLYIAIGALSVLTLRRDTRLAAMLASAIAPTGALFTFLALWTEALWRKPVRGIWWVWDAESASQLMMLALFAGFIGLKALIDDPRRADRAGALLAVLGAASLPVLYFSLHWWDLLRGETVAAREPAMSGALFLATVMVGLGFAAHATAVALRRTRCLIAERDALSRQLRRMLEPL
jgi:heme exporter protein C